jgi:hypothetical protein
VISPIGPTIAVSCRAARDHSNQRLMRPLAAVGVVVIIAGAILDSIAFGWGGVQWVLVAAALLVLYSGSGWPGAAAVHRRFTLPFVTLVLRPFGGRVEGSPPPPAAMPQPPPMPPPVA